MHIEIIAGIYKAKYFIKTFLFGAHKNLGKWILLLYEFTEDPRLGGIIDRAQAQESGRFNSALDTY